MSETIGQTILNKYRDRLKEYAKESTHDEQQPPIILRLPIEKAFEFYREAGQDVQPSVISKWGEYKGLLISIRSDWKQIDVV